MSKKTTRALASATIVLSALTMLMYATVSQGAQYFKHVDEVRGSPEQWYGKGMELHGFVVTKSIEKRPNTQDYRFKIRHGDHAVMATFSGFPPDTFKDGAEVVLTGRLGPEGFAATAMTAKCPSKYEEEGPKPPSIR